VKAELLAAHGVFWRKLLGRRLFFQEAIRFTPAADDAQKEQP
jgi:hypothetical protein